MGLPHTAEGYAEAKKILELNLAKTKRCTRPNIDPRTGVSLSNIMNTKQVEENTKLSQTVQTVACMNKFERAKSYVYSIMDKLGTVKESMAQRDDEWEEWRLEELVENLRKYTDRDP